MLRDNIEQGAKVEVREACSEIRGKDIKEAANTLFRERTGLAISGNQDLLGRASGNRRCSKAHMDEVKEKGRD